MGKKRKKKKTAPRGPGRPPVDNPLRKRILRFRDDEWDQINDYCNAQGVVRSQWIRDVVLDAMRRKK